MNTEKITRLEIINHAKNDKPIGRILTLYKELNDFDFLELELQDQGRTLKIFLSSKKKELFCKLKNQPVRLRLQMCYLCVGFSSVF